VVDVAAAVARRLGVKDYTTKIVGIRPGEKIHECIYSSHEKCLRSDTAPQLSSAELDAMVAKVVQ